MSEFFSIHKREDFLPFLFPRKVCEKNHKKFRRSSPDDCERFHKKFRRTSSKKYFSWLFLKFSVYFRYTKKEMRFLKWLLSLCWVFCLLGLRVLVCPSWARAPSWKATIGTTLWELGCMRWELYFLSAGFFLWAGKKGEFLWDFFIMKLFVKLSLKKNYF